MIGGSETSVLLTPQVLEVPPQSAVPSEERICGYRVEGKNETSKITVLTETSISSEKFLLEVEKRKEDLGDLFPLAEVVESTVTIVLNEIEGHNQSAWERLRKGTLFENWQKLTANQLKSEALQYAQCAVNVAKWASDQRETQLLEKCASNATRDFQIILRGYLSKILDEAGNKYWTQAKIQESISKILGSVDKSKILQTELNNNDLKVSQHKNNLLESLLRLQSKHAKTEKNLPNYVCPSQDEILKKYFSVQDEKLQNSGSVP